jgi:hypothetical protein
MCKLEALFQHTQFYSDSESVKWSYGWRRNWIAQNWSGRPAFGTAKTLNMSVTPLSFMVYCKFIDHFDVQAQMHNRYISPSWWDSKLATNAVSSPNLVLTVPGRCPHYGTYRPTLFSWRIWCCARNWGTLRRWVASPYISVTEIYIYIYMLQIFLLL